jgi:DNA polymerase I-like protein with 3'-5' exonuclease and polymerase domains
MTKITVFDVETTQEGAKGSPNPYYPENKLISIGINEEYLFFWHPQLSDIDLTNNKKIVQKILDETDILVGHNIKFDLSWIYSCGFTYEGKIYDTMNAEYILARGQRQRISLSECCIRRNLIQKATSLIDTYTSQGMTFKDIPPKDIEFYGRRDVECTRQLFLSQCKDFSRQVNKGLVPTVRMMNKFTYVLTAMEMNGIHIDKNILQDVREEFEKEHKHLKVSIDNSIWDTMGDTKVNPTSPEQLSGLIYGFKVTNKKKWSELFNVGINKATGKPKRRPRMSSADFNSILKKYTKPIYKTKSEQCPECHGKGKIQKVKVDGSNYVNLSKCPTCVGDGYLYNETKERAGFRVNLRNVVENFSVDSKDTTAKLVSLVSEGGFKSDKITLMTISKYSNSNIVDFVYKVTKFSAVETYLSTFVEGISTFVGWDSILHPRFMQTSTRTGRLSSKDPNFQNQPRAKTFPIRKVIISRFKDGKIMEIDYAQLEFRTAVFLAQDKQGMKDILDGVDVHQFTADIIGVSRQEAKAHTFKPLYGGLSGTEAEKKYYTEFLTKYKEIKEWHDKLEYDAISTKLITLPTGRQYCFPDAKRMPWGSSNYSTQVKNYPVQGFATADIVPLACLNAYELMKEHKVKSLLINTVHDSIVADIYPGEENLMAKLLSQATLGVKESMKSTYNIDFNVPLDIEIKIGVNWLDMEVLTI